MADRIGRLVMPRNTVSRYQVRSWLAEYLLELRDVIEIPLIKEALLVLGDQIPDRGRAVRYDQNFERGKNFMRFRLIEHLTKKYNDAKEKEDS